MQILCIGDVVGSHGCDFLRRTLPAFKRTKGIDVVIANGEKLAPDRYLHVFSNYTIP